MNGPRHPSAERGRVEFWHLCDSDRIFASSPYLRISTFPQLGMLTLAAILRADGFAVAYRDRAYDDLGQSAVDELVAAQPLFFGLYSNIALHADVLDVIAQVRGRDAELPIVVGGPAHFLADEYFAAGATLVVAGMADEVIVPLARRLRDGENVAGLPGVIVANQEWDGTLAPFPSDVDRLPFPAWDLAPPGRYRNDLAFIQKNPWYVVHASRGCPYRCHFCSRLYPIESRQYRLRSTGLVVDEMRALHERFGVRHIKFQDDTFGGQRAWLREFCARKIAGGLPVEWNASSIPVCFRDESPETFALMRRAGCTSLHFGLQTSDPTMLERIGRHGDEPRLLMDLVPKLRRAGIYSLVDLIVGLPGETEETIQAHSRFLRRLPADMVQVFPLQIVPHTRLARDYPDGHVTELSREQIHRGVRRITRRFMLRPITIWRNAAFILRHNPAYLLTLVRLVPYLARLALGRYRMADFHTERRP